jgi:hypothetical protein
MSEAAALYLLDIEGTTTSVGFVFDVLFPFARSQAAGFLASQGATAEVIETLALLAADALEVLQGRFAALTRKADGSCIVSMGLPSLAISPKVTATSDTTPLNGARTLKNPVWVCAARVWACWACT